MNDYVWWLRYFFMKELGGTIWIADIYHYEDYIGYHVFCKASYLTFAS